MIASGAVIRSNEVRDLTTQLARPCLLDELSVRSSLIMIVLQGVERDDGV